MNTQSALHPTDQTLNAYGRGKLDSAAADSVDQHLASCSDCRRRVDDLTSDSSLGPPQDARNRSNSTGPVVSSLTGLSTLDRDANPGAPPPASTLPPGLADHADYKILRELGRGGMGVVYLAENTLMGRKEVLKVVGSHLISRPGVLERFLREIRSAAKLHHSNIVAAYSAIRLGESLVLTMEYVEGLDLSRMVKAKGPLPVAQTCNYIHQAALGLQHAHEHGMVHRDIKPANLILAREGKKAIVKVLDFGLAKVTSEGQPDHNLTVEGQMLGTPAYIAPEQIRNAQSADIRADIYSLGCTFYYLLSGAVPFHGDNLWDLYQAHFSMDATPLNLARPEVPVEVAALVAKMMAKEPRKRFQTPGEVARALSPFFKPAASPPAGSSGEMSRVDAQVVPDQAHGVGPASPRPVAEVLVPARRSPSESGADGVAWEGLIAIKKDEPSIGTARPKPEGSNTETVAGPVHRPPWSRPAIIAATVFGLLALGVIIYVETRNFIVRRGDDEALRVENKPPESDSDLAGTDEIKELSRLKPEDSKEITRLDHRERVQRVAFSPDGLCTLTGVVDGEHWRTGEGGNSFAPRPYSIGLREVASGRTLFTMRGEGVVVAALALSSDGRYAASSDPLVSRHPILIWDIKTGKSIHKLSQSDTTNRTQCTTLSFSQDDRRLMAALQNGTVLAWELVTEQERPPITLEAGPVKLDEFPATAFSPDRRHLVTGRRSGAVELWDLQTGQRLQSFAGHTGVVRGVACSADGRLILSCGSDNTVRLWDVASGKELRQLGSDDRPVSCVTFSPEGRRALSAGIDGIVQLWDLASGKELCRMEGHTMVVNSVAFSPDGRRAASGSDDRTVRLWRLPESGVAGETPPRTTEPPIRSPVVESPVPQPKAEATPSVSLVPVKPTGPPEARRAAPGNPTSPITNSIGMKLVLIPAGGFLMGSPGTDTQAKDDEKPQHRVQIGRPFYLGVYEVTQEQYQTVIGKNPSRSSGSAYLPVEQVSWLDAIAFCNQLSAREKLRPCYKSRGGVRPDGEGYRLPTEAEWEYACRAGTQTRYHFGENAANLSEYAWCKNTSDGKTHPVGTKRPNRWGLHDMNGNVAEWCWDAFDKDYYRQTLGADPARSSGTAPRVIRGVSLHGAGQNCRSAFRDKRPREKSYDYLGFRIARVYTGR